jgi:hypothetical protein
MINTSIRGMTASGYILDDVSFYPGNFRLQYLTDPWPSHNFRGYDGGNLTGSHAFEFKTTQAKHKSFYVPTTRHKQISEELNEPEVLTIPEKYFGPNYKTLLNFWIYWDSLSLDKRCCYQDLLNSLSGSIWCQAYCEARISSGKVMNCTVSLLCWEMEIAGMHIILDEGKPLTFIPLLEKL